MKVALGMYKLAPPVVPFYRFFFGCEGSPTNIDKKGKKWAPTYSSLSNLDLENMVSRVPGLAFGCESSSRRVTNERRDGPILWMVLEIHFASLANPL